MKDIYEILKDKGCVNAYDIGFHTEAINVQRRNALINGLIKDADKFLSDKFRKINTDNRLAKTTFKVIS